MDLLRPISVVFFTASFSICVSAYSPKALAHVKCRISLPFGGWTEGCPHAHGGVIDNTPLDPDTWDINDWFDSGAGELCEVNGRITAERNRDRDQGLASIQKYYLRPLYGDLVDEVTVIWGALLNDHVTFMGRTLRLGSAGQVYGNTIYMAEERQPLSTLQLTILAHEFVHVQQYRNYGSLDSFCTNYIAGFWGNGYDQNPHEMEADEREFRFALALSRQLDTFEGPHYRHPAPSWDFRTQPVLPYYLLDPANLYREVLGREPEPGNVEGIIQSLASGSTSTEERRIMASSSESRNNLVNLYREILGREPEPGNVEGLVNALANGSTLAQERRTMADSRESRTNLANLYREILGREPEPGNVEGLVDRLANGSTLAQERQTMADSEEAQQRRRR